MPNTQNQPENPGKDAFVAEMGRDAEYETDVGDIEYAIVFESQSLDTQPIAQRTSRQGREAGQTVYGSRLRIGSNAQR